MKNNITLNFNTEDVLKLMATSEVFRSLIVDRLFTHGAAAKREHTSAFKSAVIDTIRRVRRDNPNPSWDSLKVKSIIALKEMDLRPFTVEEVSEPVACQGHMEKTHMKYGLHDCKEGMGLLQAKLTYEYWVDCVD
jgi:hypothetical protein